MLGAGKDAFPHFLPESLHGALDFGPEVGVLLDELRHLFPAEAEEIVSHEHLAVAEGAGADADSRDPEAGRDFPCHLGRDALENEVRAWTR